MLKNKNFFDIICGNNEDDLNDYLLAKGKSPKPVCPVMFISSECDIENKSED